MMESIQRRLFALLMSLMVGLAAVPASAEPYTDDQVNTRPSGAAMFADAILVRPLLLAVTAGGTALFLVTLPFSVLGGNVGEAGKTMVIGPAKSTFTRCLGCTAVQDEWKHKRTLEEAEEM